MTAILYQCFLTMELFGKEPEHFGTINQMFLKFLKEYPASDVVEAFGYYVQQRSKFPTVADILAILEGRVMLDKTYYLKLEKRRQNNDRLSDEEKNYIVQYEKQIREEWQ